MSSSLTQANVNTQVLGATNEASSEVLGALFGGGGGSSARIPGVGSWMQVGTFSSSSHMEQFTVRRKAEKNGTDTYYIYLPYGSFTVEGYDITNTIRESGVVQEKLSTDVYKIDCKAGQKLYLHLQFPTSGGDEGEDEGEDATSSRKNFSAKIDTTEPSDKDQSVVSWTLAEIKSDKTVIQHIRGKLCLFYPRYL